MVSLESPHHIVLIITTYNRLDTLVRVLVDCSVQTNHAFDITVADDDSHDDTRSIIEAATKTASYPLRHVWYPDDGFHAGETCNRSALAMDADHLAFLDGDCMPRPDFVVRHRVLIERGCLLSGNRTLLDEAMTREVVAQQIDIHLRDRMYWSVAWCTGRVNKFVPLLVPGSPVPRTFKNISLCGIKSCNLGVRRSDFERVNGFDQSSVG